MLGWGVVKGLGVTLRHFGETYVEDIKYFFKRETGISLLEYRMAPESKGIYTMQYPKEVPVIPERFRFLPFLVTNYEGAEQDKRREANRCTSCGICAKACPPQCIWIVRTTNAQGRPVPQPADFHIDTDICMNCGYCAEFCPFDAIIMDHDYALADEKRAPDHIYGLNQLLKSAGYYQEIRPAQFVAREEKRRLAEEEKRRKAEAKAAALAAKKAAKNQDG